MRKNNSFISVKQDETIVMTIHQTGDIGRWEVEWEKNELMLVYTVYHPCEIFVFNQVQIMNWIARNF